MSKTTSNLTAAGALDGTEKVALVQGGNSRRSTAQAVANTATALAGTPTAPTAAANTNTTQIATTAFAKAEADAAEAAAIAAIPAIASQAEAEAGSNNTKMMTALRTAQAITVLGGGSGITDPGGSNDDVLQRKAGAWTHRTLAQLASDLGVIAGDTVSLTDKNPNYVFVNDIYPAGEGPIGATQTPDDLGYANIADYIADLPAMFQDAADSFADQLPTINDECDWIAWQTATNYLYDRGLGNGGTVNFSSGTIVGDGAYVVNRTVTFNHEAIKVVGVGPSGRFGGTRITYNGSNGTLAEPVYIFDFYLYDEFSYAGSRVHNTASSGIGLQMENVLFNGTGGSMTSASQNVSGYISAVRLRYSAQVEIRRCTFGGTLYDGIVVTAPSLFMTFESNFFYGVHRDAIAIHGFEGNYTTTIYSRFNEFGYVGRYAHCMDLASATTPQPIFEGNSYEFTFAGSYYQLNPEWYFHGVKAASVFNGCGGIRSSNSFYEGVVGNGVCDVCMHFIECDPISLIDEPGQIYITSNDFDAARSTDAIAYQDLTVTPTAVAKGATTTITASNAYVGGEVIHFRRHGGGGGSINALYGPAFIVASPTGANFVLSGVDSSGWSGTFSAGARCGIGHRHLDVTDARNYRVGYTGKFGAASKLYITNTSMTGITMLLFADAATMDATAYGAIQNSGVSGWLIPTMNAVGRNGKKVTPITTAKPVLRSVASLVALHNVSTGFRMYGNWNPATFSGDYICYGATVLGFAVWAADTAKFATFSQDGAYTPRFFVVPTSGNFNGYLYQCTATAGDTKTHATTEPTWPTTIGDTVVDDQVTWTCVAQIFHQDENLRPEVMQFGMRRFQMYANGAPTVGRFTQGDQAIYRLPDAGGGSDPFVGRICVLGGYPGTWKTFGAISA